MPPSDIICAQCDAYLGETPGTAVSHGVCQECFRGNLSSIGLSEEAIEQHLTEALGPLGSRRIELRGASADPRVRAIRKDEKVGKGSQSSIDETMTDSELLEELSELGITSPKEAVSWAQKIDRIFWEREGGGTGLYG